MANLILQMEQQLVEELSKAHITVLSSSRFGTNQDPALVEGVFVSPSKSHHSYIFKKSIYIYIFSFFLQVRDARVFIINSYEDKAKQLLCSVSVLLIMIISRL